MHVGVTSAASRRAAAAAAERAGLAALVVETPVDSTWAELEAAHRRWDERLHGLLMRGEVITALVPEANAVAVRIASTVSAAERKQLAAEAAASSVRVVLETDEHAGFGIAREARCRAFEYEKAYCDPTLPGGVSLVDPGAGRCTTGPAVIKSPLGADTTETFILTAGHCIDAVGELFSSSTKAEVSKSIGKSVITLNEPAEEVDVGVIKIENTEWMNATLTPIDAALTHWEGLESEPDPVVGEQEPMAKTTSCHEGQSTAGVCGWITTTKMTVKGLKELVEVQKLAEVSEPGDSGGPWYAGGTPDNRIVEGTHVGRLVENGVVTKFSLFHPLAYDLQRLAAKGQAYQLLTTANQTRPKCKMPGKPCFNSGAGSPTLTGKQPEGVNDVFSGDAGSVECENTSLTGSFVNGGSADVEAKFSPSFIGCKGFGIATTVDANGCEFVFHSDNKEFAIKCPAGKKIAFTNAGCEVTIGEQSKLTGISAFTNEGTGAGRAVTIDFEIGGIAYEEHQKTLHTCKNETKTTTGGTYKGRTTITAEVFGFPIGLWVE